MMEIKGTQLIGFGESAEGGETFAAVAPATGEAIGPDFHEALSVEIERALNLAAEAADVMRTYSGARLGGLCEAIADRLEANRGVILERCGIESGYGEVRLAGEFARTVNQLRLFADVAREGDWLNVRIDHAEPGREPLPKPDVRRMETPIGPVVVFGASNFPLALSTVGGDTASALSAGCPVVVKAHPSHPGTSELMARAAIEAVREQGFPEGTLSLLQGRAEGVGGELVMNRATRAVGFTGSLRGGRALYDLAAGRKDPIPVYAEMGSVNPQFVLAGKLAADPDGFAEALFGSVTLGNGQFCTNPGLVFVREGEAANAFLERYRSLVNEAGPGPLLNRGIENAFASGLEALGDVPGVEILCGEWDGAGICGKPALATVDLLRFEQSLDSLVDEIFGPSTLVVLCPEDTDYAGIAVSLPGQLAASLHGTEEELPGAGDVLRELSRIAGRVVVNGFPTGIEVCHAMHHGGPYPATTDAHFTSIGTGAIARWGRSVCFQNVPEAMLPDALKEANPLGLTRWVDGRRTG